jgi:hypothetical protein
MGLTFRPPSPSRDIALVVEVDAALGVVELKVTGRRHAHNVNVLKEKEEYIWVTYIEREQGSETHNTCS